MSCHAAALQIWREVSPVQEPNPRRLLLTSCTATETAVQKSQRFKETQEHDVNTVVGNRAMLLRWTFPVRLPLRDEEPPRQGKRTTHFERRYRSNGIVVEHEPQTGALHTL
jgi:hypothetical protein